MRTEVEGLDLDALEKVAREATAGPHVALSAPAGHEPPADVCQFGVVSEPLHREVCRAWDRQDAVFFATFDPPTVLRLLTALRAQAERVRVLEGERDEARGVVRETLWMARRYADGRQTYAVGMFNDAAMLAVAGGYASGEPDGTIFARDGSAPEYRSAEARAEAAERRAGELEGAACEAEAQITYLHEKFGETGSGNAVLAKLRRLIGHGEPALLPAIQAENPQEHDDE